MRGIKFCALLAVMILTAGIACASEVPANPFSGFGLFTEYVTSGSVRLNVGGMPDYSGVSGFVAGNVGLRGKFKDGADRSSLPYGTLTVTSGDYSGARYRLSPGGSSSSSSYVNYSHYANVEAGVRVMWNLYTSPDVVVGSAVIKSVSDIAPVSIGRNDVIPFVKATPLTGSNSSRLRIDVSFVRSGDLGTPVAAGYDAVAVNGGEVPDFLKPYPVRHTFTMSANYSYSRTVSVSCYKDKASYTWYFVIPESVIEFGKLELNSQPVIIKEGTTESFTVKLPSSYASGDISDSILTVGNESVIEAGSVSFTQGKGWTSGSDSEDKSVLSFTLTGVAPGRTAIRLAIPNDDTYYREIHVVDASGDMNLEEGTTSLRPLLASITYADFKDGKPDYTTAIDSGFQLVGVGGFTGAKEAEGSYRDSSGDVHTYTYYTGPSGFFGVTKGARHIIHELRLNSSTGKTYSLYNGVSFSTNSSDYFNSEWPRTLSFGASSDIAGLNVWLEFPESPDMNLSSLTFTPEVMSSFLSMDKMRTTAMQLEDFAPYFEVKGTSLDWSFVNPSTMEKVSPSGVSDISVYYEGVTGTGGTVDLASSVSYIPFSYTYGGIVYRWYFDGETESGAITSLELTPTFTANANTVPVVEGRPAQDTVSFADYVSITLKSNKPITQNAYYNNRSSLYGTIYVSNDMSGDETITLYPDFEDEYISGDVWYGTLTYEASTHYFMPGKTVRWVFESDIVKNGSAVIPAIDSSIADGLTTALKINRDGLNAETLEWSVNTSGDNDGVNVRVNSYAGLELSSDARTGSMSIGLPDSFLDGIGFSIERGGMNYSWSYWPVNSPSSYYYYDSLPVFTWNTENPDLPLAMRKGETREITLTVSDDYGNIKPLVGNPDIVSMTVVASTDSTATVRLTALEAGMTTLGMTYQRKYVETVYPDGGDVVYTSALPGVKSSVELEGDDVIDVVLNSDGTATAGGSTVPAYDYVWHADPQHPAEYWTLGADGTDELDADAYEAAIESAGTNNGLYIARDIRYTPNTLGFTTSQTAQKDEDTEYVVYYDSSSSAVAAAIAKLGETYGTAYSTDKYIFATLPMSTSGGGGTPGGDNRPDFPGGEDSGDNRPDFPGGEDSGYNRPTPPGGDDDTRMPAMTRATSDTIAAMSTMTHSASDAYNNPVLHITEPGTYRISGTWHGQIWIEAGAKAKHQVGIILNGVEVSCDVAPALVFYKVYKWAEDKGYDDQSTLAANNLWRDGLSDLMMGDDDGSEVGALVEIADGTTNTFTGANVYRILELSPKLDDDDNPKYTGSGIGTDISEQQKMYKLDGAFHSRRSIIIGGGSEGTGTLNITSTTCEGLDSEMHMLVDGGNITVSAPDDGINVNEDYVSVFTMDGGTLNVSSTNADGIDSNGWIAIKGGTLNISAGNQSQNSAGEAGLDAENGTYISDSATYNWTAAGSGSPDTPTDPDIPTPDSPDIPTPDSPDIPTPDSPDVPTPEPETRVTYYGNYVAWPREIWVSELDTSTGKYRVPHLTDDVDALIASLGGSTSWTDYDGGTSGGGTTTTPEYDESAKNVGYSGLSVYPRFAMPKDPSADAYKAALEFVDTLNLPYGVDMFSDSNMTVIASRDAAAVWSAMKDELLSKDTPQLVAIVLPEMSVQEAGFYVFRLPADNITGSSQAVFWDAGLSGDTAYPSYYVTSEDLSRQMFIDDSGNVTGAVDGEDYINVAAYLGEGVYIPVITAAATSNDLAILSGNAPVPPTSPDVPTPTSPDVPTPTSPDVPAPTSPDAPVVPETVKPTKPSVDTETVANVLRNILNRQGVEVMELPASSSGSSRTVDDVPSSQLTAIQSQGREVAAVLPEITVETAAIYIFGVSLDNLAPGTAIFLDMTTRLIASEAVSASDSYAGEYTFLNDAGDEVYTVPANRHVNLAAYLEPEYTYSPVITTSSSNADDNNTTGVGSSSGGCEAGFGLMAAVLLSGLALATRKK